MHPLLVRRLGVRQRQYVQGARDVVQACQQAGGARGSHVQEEAPAGGALRGRRRHQCRPGAGGYYAVAVHVGRGVGRGGQGKLIGGMESGAGERPLVSGRPRPPGVPARWGPLQPRPLASRGRLETVGGRRGGGVRIAARTAQLPPGTRPAAGVLAPAPAPAAAQPAGIWGALPRPHDLWGGVQSVKGWHHLSAPQGQRFSTGCMRAVA